MRREFARNFWKRYLHLIRNDAAEMPIANPALDFNLRAKSGEYDDIPADEYDQILNDVTELQSIWHNARQRPASEILLEALRRTSISGEALDHIADLLAESSENSSYFKEEEEEVPFDSSVGGAEADASPESESADGDAGDAQLTPRAIYERIDGRVYAQEAAKRAASLIFYNMTAGRRSNTIFCGPTGCGKSEIWRCMAKLFPDAVRIFDASRLTADGWKGSLHVRDIFEGVPRWALDDGMIVVVDEADKLCCETAVSSNGTNYNALTQNSLLKMLDGDVIEFGKEDGRRAFSVDCSHVSVVLLGAFENLLQGKSQRSSAGIGFGAAARVDCNYENTEITYDDLIRAGMRREIAGRMNRIVPLRPLDAADYRAILMGPVLKDLQDTYPKPIEIEADFAERLAAEAAATGLGVRWMKSQIANIIDDLVFDDPAAETYTVSLPLQAQKDTCRHCSQAGR